MYRSSHSKHIRPHLFGRSGVDTANPSPECHNHPWVWWSQARETTVRGGRPQARLKTIGQNAERITVMYYKRLLVYYRGEIRFVPRGARDECTYICIPSLPRAVSFQPCSLPATAAFTRFLQAHIMRNDRGRRGGKAGAKNGRGEGRGEGQ